ncbi:MAG: PKD domain-containing protein [Bacteroidetes bacterium]|nr:PKD domain-containing protein [Bacteroidota bacterium]
MPFDAANASICDESGLLQFYSNGANIANWQHEIMENGDTINPGGITGGNLDEQKLPQGVLILPFPDYPGEYYMFHAGQMILFSPAGSLTLGCRPLYYSHIDMNANEGVGIVIEKNASIINDTLDFGKITATRHANGRDWWVVVNEFFSNKSYSILLSPDGISAIREQEVGEPLSSGLGQACFSPDGRIYVNVSLTGEGDDAAYIYDFDRATGQLSNQRIIPLEGDLVSAGIAISPNSRYCYISAYLNILQVDLLADDLYESMDTVATYDGYEEPIPGTEGLSLATVFFMAQLAPNGKIYLNTTNSVRSLHVINQPNLPGDSCDVQQHAIQLPTLNAFSLPNFPNYKLRNLVGSPADTLGPIAAYGFTPGGLTLSFEDESLKSPTAWQWDFGDGGSSTQQNPVHEYAQEGEYEVCLSVSNLYGADTLCQTVQVQLTSVGEEEGQVLVELFPNPTQSKVWLRTAGLEDRMPVRLELYSATGHLILQQSFLPNHQQELDLSSYPKGVYFYRLSQGDELLQSNKLIKQ